MPSRKKKSSFNIYPLLGAAVILVVGFAAGRVFNVDETSMLFVQQAVTGSLRPANADSGTYTLTMLGVKPHTLIFSDRPQRIVGSWTNTDFVTRWNQGADSFANDPPNAVLLSHSTVDGKEYAVAVELTNPEFDGPGGWLTYTVKILNETNPDDLTISSDRHMQDFPEILRSPALFIDNTGVWSPNAYAPGTGEQPMGES